MSEIIKVGMADLKTCVSPDGVTTLGLGSCVGIAIRDPVTKIGGLAHIMLPDSTTIRNRILQNLRIRELMNWYARWKNLVRERQEWLLRLPVALPCLHFRVVTT